MWQTQIWPVDASDQSFVLKQRVLKREAVAVAYRMVKSLQVLVVPFSPLSPSCITQMLGKCIHPCLGKQMLSSLDCHQKYLEDKFTFTPKTRCARSKPAYWARRENNRRKSYQLATTSNNSTYQDRRLTSVSLRRLTIRPAREVRKLFFFNCYKVVFQTLCKTSYLSLTSHLLQIAGRKYSTQFLKLSCTIA